MKRIKLSRLDAFALLAGAVLPFAFAPFYFSVIGLLSPAVLLLIFQTSSPKQAAKQGLLYGLSFFTVGISWVYISVHVYGQAPIPLALLITFLFIGYLSLFFAALGYFVNRCASKNALTKNLLVFPSFWVIFELLRTWLLTGFPWVLLGYSQTNTWLRGFAPFLSVYGVSFITAFMSGILVSCYQYRKLKVQASLVSALVALSVVGLMLTNIHWTKATGNSLKVTMIQGNIQQQMKWQPEQIARSLELYQEYTQKNWDSDLIIWPEAAITLPLHLAKEFTDALGQEAKRHGATIITGIPVVEPKEDHNAMIALGNGNGLYFKRHLVPFGEYIPFRFILALLAQGMQIPMSDMTPGSQQQAPLVANGVNIAPYICYEVAYPLEFLSFLPKAQLLLTVTDDSWFGHSIAAAQHLQMAQMRALETGRYLLFSSNTGITAVIDPEGNIVKTIPTFTEATLNTVVYPMQGATPWMRFKFYPLAMLILLSLIFAMLRRNHP